MWHKTSRKFHRKPLFAFLTETHLKFKYERKFSGETIEKSRALIIDWNIKTIRLLIKAIHYENKFINENKL